MAERPAPGAIPWAGVTLLALLLFLPLASAHSVVEASSPAAGEHLDEAPATVWIEFTEEMDPKPTILEVRDETGARWDDGRILVRSPTRVEVRLVPAAQNLTDAVVWVDWTTLSNVDGHKSHGRFGFAVGNATPPLASEARAIPITWQALVGKSVAFLGLTLAVGGLAFEAYVLRSAEEQAPPWLLRFMAAGGAAQLAGLSLLAATQVAASGLTPREYLWGTEFGRGLAWRILLAGAFALAASSTHLRHSSGTAARGVLVALLLLLYARYSHTAAALRPLAWGVLVDGAHLVAVTAWIGGLAVLALSLRTALGADASRLRRVTARFHRLATGCVLVLVATGLLMLVGILGTPGPGWAERLASPYGRLLVAKILAALATLALGVYNRARFVAPFRDLSFRPAPGAFRRFVTWETGLGLLAMVSAGFLTNFSPVAT